MLCSGFGFPVTSLIAIRRQTRPTDSDTSARWRRSDGGNCEILTINMYASVLFSAKFDFSLLFLL